MTDPELDHDVRSERKLLEAITAAIRGDRDTAADAVAYMNEAAARDYWTALGDVRDMIEAADGGSGERPWD